MRIAHFSDLHLLSLEGVRPHRFLNKRLTGWVNLRLKRGSIHRAAYVRAIAREVSRLHVDHVVVTGDLTNLALEPEYALVRDTLEHDLALDRSHVTVVPGNHDLYTRGALRSRRFEEHLGPYLESELPELAVDVGGARFPNVKLAGDVVIIGLCSAVPRAPLVAAGELGHAQQEALARILAHPEVTKRFVVIAIHHPVVNDWPAVKTFLEGLRDASPLLEILSRLRAGLVLHGHLHRRIQRDIPTLGGRLVQVGATSASLHHVGEDRMAGFDVYDIEPGKAPRLEGHVYTPADGSFHVESIPKYV